MNMHGCKSSPSSSPDHESSSVTFSSNLAGGCIIHSSFLISSDWSLKRTITIKFCPRFIKSIFKSTVLKKIHLAKSNKNNTYLEILLHAYSLKRGKHMSPLSGSLGLVFQTHTNWTCATLFHTERKEVTYSDFKKCIKIFGCSSYKRYKVNAKNPLVTTEYFLPISS